MLILIYGWHRTPIFIPKQTNKNSKIRFSVLIPVRNEAENITNLLNDLALQDLDTSNFEVLVLDDNSEDNTAEIVRNFISKAPYSLQLISVPAAGSAHKKRAITLGVSKAKYEYIITTDGDCRVDKSWLSTFSNFIESKSKTSQEAFFIAGAVRLNHTRDFFAALQASEFATLIGTGGAALNLGFPFTCNGANMAYSKEKFIELGGYQSDETNKDEGYKISSGDDEFLLHKFHKKYAQHIFFLKSKKAIVETEATKTWKQFYHQRKRWASKWNQHKKISHAAISVFVFVVQVLTLLTLVSMTSTLMNANFEVFDVEYINYLYCTFFIRMLTELIFLFSILIFLKQKRVIFTLPFWWIFYSFYAIFFGIVAQKKGYQWKGRQTK
ncbi:glycosyltransferase [Bernardetia sp.]|uniref:glycosyltransferase n=1 Tax=Bernardetia sp. TaxID=1937974 RepID=UPI0025C3C07B|nr:glycosyltransferase [Bernardetia sp.]